MAAVAIIPSLAKAGLSFLTSIFAAHARKVKVEASTLNGAFPAWRQEIAATVDAYNNGDIDKTSALAYIDQGKSLYYQQVKGIQRGNVPDGGVGVQGYIKDSYGRFAPIDPCNGACYIGYYYIEPEAEIVKQAIQSGQDQTITLAAFNIRNGDSQPTLTLHISPPVTAALSESATKVEAALKKNPLLWGAAAFGVMALLLARK